MFSFKDRLGSSFSLFWTRLIRLGLLIILLCATLVVYADTIQNDVGVVVGNDTIRVGNSTIINYFIHATGGDGCDASDGGSATVNIIVPASVTASPTVLAFNTCETNKPVTFSSNTPGDYLITVAASDANGDSYNTNPAKFTLHVLANTAPILTLPSPITAEATSGAGAAVNFSATATDAEDNPDPTPSCSPASGSVFPLGTTPVNCSVVDSGSLSASGSFTVTVRDTTAPVIAPHANEIAEASSASGAIVNYSSPSTSDAVDGAGTASCSPASGSLFPSGATTVTCTKSDLAGNAALSTSFTITVADTTAPTIAPQADITVEAVNGLGTNVNYLSPVTSDAVSGAGVANCSPASGSLFPLGSTTVTCTASDAAGNGSSSTFAIIVRDTTAPAIAPHGNEVVEATSAAGAIVTYASPATTDAVSGDGFATCSPASGETFPLGTTTVTCTASDTAGNSSSSTFSVLVRDTTAPGIAPHINEVREATSAAGATVNYVSPTTSDAVDGAGTASCTPVSGSTFALGLHTVTCTASDAAGNSSSSTFSVLVRDTTAPVIAPHLDVTAEATSAAGATVNYGVPSTSDAVDGAGTATCIPANNTLFALGDTTVNCTASDTQGNSSSSQFVVHVLDTTAPEIAPHDDLTAEATSAAGAVVNYDSPTTSDAVDGAGVASCTPVSGSTFALGAHTVTCTASDAAGNERSSNFSITVKDTTAPEIAPHANIEAEATSAAGAVVNYDSPTTSDAVDGAGVASCAPVSGSTFALGLHTVTCTASDAAGNERSSNFSITVEDTTAPEIAPHANIEAEATSAAGAVVNYDSPITSDAVDGAGVASCTPASGSTFALGVHTVTCTASDAAGNERSSNFSITVEDTTAPVIALHADVEAEATSAAGAIVSYTSPSTTDAVAGNGIAVCSPASGLVFPLGSTTITCTASDAAGNSSSSNFAVIVQDTTAPVIAAHADVEAEATSAAGAIVSYDSPTTSDAVDGNGVASCTPASGSGFPLGSSTVECSAEDAAGNSSSSSFEVIVQDTTAPVIASHDDVTVEAASAAGTIVNYGVPSTTDAVDGAGTAVCSPADNTLFAVGDTTVECSAEDAAGNSSSSSFVVHVVDTIAPVITVPANITAEATSAAGASVTFNATYTDAVAGNGNAVCSPASGSTFALGITSVSCSKTDAAGNTGSNSFSVSVQDTTAPVIAPHVDVEAEATSAAGAIVSYTSPSTTDAVAGNGIAVCSPASGLVFPLGSTTITCTASDAAGNSSSSTFAVIVEDTTAPVIIIFNIVKGATANSSAIVTYSASAEDAVDGIRPVTCSPASGSSFPVGLSTITCTSSDTRGNTRSQTANVTVTYSFNGFYQPIDMGIVNVVNAGRAIPVKFSLGGYQGMNIFMSGSPSSIIGACSTNSPTDSIEETLTVSQSGLSYDATTGQYTYVWKSEKSWAGSCRTLIVRFADGTVMFAYFKFTK